VLNIYTNVDSAAPDFSKEVTEEGAKILELVLRDWARRSGAAEEQDGEDVAMEVEDSPDEQVRVLREVFEQYRSQIEGNAWCQSVLGSL
jgi:hypothetical protein